jgi:hypothetical protein
MSYHQSAGQNTNQNCIHEEIKSRFIGNLVQNLLSFHGLCENVKIKIVLPVVLYWCEIVPHLRKNTD